MPAALPPWNLYRAAAASYYLLAVELEGRLRAKRPRASTKTPRGRGAKKQQAAPKASGAEANGEGARAGEAGEGPARRACAAPRRAMGTRKGEHDT